MSDTRCKCTVSMIMDEDENCISFRAGTEYVWRWPTDEEEADHPDCYAVFKSEISDKHLMGYEDVVKHFGR